MYAHFPLTLFERTDRNGVVKVLGVLRVNRYGQHIAHVEAAGHFFGRDSGFYFLGSAFYVGGILVGQTVLGKDGVHFGIVFALLTKDVYHLPYGTLRILGPFHNLHQSLVACLTTLERRLGNKNVGRQRAAFGNEEGVILFHLELPDKGILHAFHNLRYLRLTSMPMSAGKHRNSYAVAVEGMHRISLAHENILSAIVGHENIMPIALAAEGSYHIVAAVYTAIHPFCGTRKVIVEHEVVNYIHHQHFCAMRLGLQVAEDVLYI